MGRNEKRKERYDYYQKIGFTAKEARKLRDQSASKGQSAIDSRLTEIRGKRKKELTPEDKVFLKKSKESRKKKAEESIIIDTRKNRLKLFRKWSSKYEGFPDDILDDIIEVNKVHGKPPYKTNSFGFRVFYHYYVLGENQGDAVDNVRNSPDGS